jgi:hypothetical protein
MIQFLTIMKKTAFFLAAILAIVSCQKEIQVSSVTVDPANVSIVVGGKQLLRATAAPADATTITETAWSSSNEMVATVAPTGLVTAVAPGEATISAEIGGVVGTCKITVTDTEITGIAFKSSSETAIAVTAGEERELEIIFSPDNPTNKSVEWKTSDPKIATVTPGADGKATVVFSGSGVVEITATTQVSNQTASQKFVILGDAKLYIMEETIYAGKPAVWKVNAAAYPGIKDAVWTVGDKEYEGNEATFAVDVDQSFEEAVEGKEFGNASVKLVAKIEGVEVSDVIDVPVEILWIEKDITTWSRNANPVFNKACTKVYFITRNQDGGGLAERHLIQLDLQTKEIVEVNLKMDKASIKTDNGGMFCVNPLNGDIYACNNQAIYCFAEAGLTKKWQFDVPVGDPSKMPPSIMVGSGPALSNDCSVLFVACGNNMFYALNTATGEKLSELDFNDNVETFNRKGNNYTKGLGACQFAVWGDNNIIMHRNVGLSSVEWITFKDNKLAIEKESNSVTGSTTDIASPIIDKTQTWVYFMGHSTICYIPLKGYADALHLTGSADGRGMHMNGCLSDGYLYTPTQNGSWIMQVDVSGSYPVNAYRNIFEESGGNNNRNYDSVSADENGCLYFNHRVSGRMYLLRGTPKEDGSFNNRVIASFPMNNYQACLNVGGNYMVTCCRIDNSISRIFVRCIGANRASGWSGMGGDVCSTKNANLVYGN